MRKSITLDERVLNCLLCVLAIILIQSCGGQQDGPPPPEAVGVDFFELKPSTVEIENKYPATIEGSVNVDIKAQVSGYLEIIYVKEGDYVSKGQSLFKIKGEVFQEQINNNQAALKSALASQSNARLEMEKIRPLVEGNVVSDMQLKSAQASYEAASAQVAQARAALSSVQINAAFAIIKAPVSGYIGRIPNRIGNLVTPSDSAPLTTLSDINNVFAYFSLSEAGYLSFSRKNQANADVRTIDLILADGSTYNQKGRLEIASGNIDRATGSIAMKAVFSNPDKLLRSGGTARVVLKDAFDEALSVPMSSVKDIQDKLFVFRLADSNKVNMVPIEVAGTSGNRYLIKSGLKAGDQVAINRIDILNEGMVVIPTP